MTTRDLQNSLADDIFRNDFFDAYLEGRLEEDTSLRVAFETLLAQNSDLNTDFAAHCLFRQHIFDKAAHEVVKNLRTQADMPTSKVVPIMLTVWKRPVVWLAAAALAVLFIALWWFNRSTPQSVEFTPQTAMVKVMKTTTADFGLIPSAEDRIYILELFVSVEGNPKVTPQYNFYGDTLRLRLQKPMPLDSLNIAAKNPFTDDYIVLIERDTYRIHRNPKREWSNLGQSKSK